MRLGLDLRGIPDADQRLRLAAEADALGLWAVLTAGSGPGTEALDAAELAGATETVHVLLWMAESDEHPFTLAEEVSVLDHLSARRAGVVVAEPLVDRVRGWLAGEVVDGVALAPPPAQTRVPTWAPGELATVELTGDLEADRAVIDDHLGGGTTHLVVAWPNDTLTLARHLASRSVGPGFPQLVADLADQTAKRP